MIFYTQRYLIGRIWCFTWNEKSFTLNLGVFMSYDSKNMGFKGLDAVRKRPGMYIGIPMMVLVFTIWFEVVDNSVDEA